MISSYSSISSVAECLKKNGFQLKYDIDSNTVMLTDDNGDIKFNAIYTKEEVNALISSGGGLTPEDFLK